MASSPDVIVATNSQAVAAAMSQTSSIPIVMLDVSHPVEAGFIKSLASPGSNVTGLTNQSKDIAAKHYDLLREINPRVERVALLFTPSNAGSVLGFQDQTATAQQAGISVIPVPFESAADLDSAAQIVRQGSAQALQVHNTPVALMNRLLIAKLAIELGLPTISFYPTMARDGLLMSYGADQAESWRRAATYVDRLLKGESPSDLPVEQPTAFKLVLNLKTANALGLSIPPTLLARADEVIE
jgi:putative ABC transport system substrate-binding protein